MASLTLSSILPLLSAGPSVPFVRLFVVRLSSVPYRERLLVRHARAGGLETLERALQLHFTLSLARSSIRNGPGQVELKEAA